MGSSRAERPASRVVRVVVFAAVCGRVTARPGVDANPAWTRLRPPFTALTSEPVEQRLHPALVAQHLRPPPGDAANGELDGRIHREDEAHQASAGGVRVDDRPPIDLHDDLLIAMLGDADLCSADALAVDLRPAQRARPQEQERQPCAIPREPATGGDIRLQLLPQAVHKDRHRLEAAVHWIEVDEDPSTGATLTPDPDDRAGTDDGPGAEPDPSATCARSPSAGDATSRAGRRHDRDVLSYEERQWLRALRDRQARERLVELQPNAHRCLGCGVPLHERTPGCRHCRFRHAARRRRNRQLFAELRLPDEGRAHGGRARWTGSGAA